MQLKQFKEDLIRKLIYKYCELFGVEFQTNLPPEFVISFHARQRMRERIGVNPRKMKQLTIKAWFCNDRVKSVVKNRSEYFDKLHGGKPHFRSCMGYTFVFALHYLHDISYPQKVLVTVLK